MSELKPSKRSKAQKERDDRATTVLRLFLGAVASASMYKSKGSEGRFFNRVHAAGYARELDELLDAGAIIDMKAATGPFFNIVFEEELEAMANEET